ncbi:MAG: type II toxin-antitoxin system HicA family toxin [Dehalococcoidia bacterium]|nr:type II toxin-antitoxin system HicA family toxin [Dehalococcoidia bacterium]
MTEAPSLPYLKVVNALQRAGFTVIRQRGSHIRLQKRTREGLIKITVPAHKPVKKTTLAKLIKQSGLSLEEFKELL